MTSSSGTFPTVIFGDPDILSKLSSQHADAAAPRTIGGLELPVSPPIKPMLTGSSSHSTRSMEDDAPEAEEIKDPHTIVLQKKPFAFGGYADVYRATWTPTDRTEPLQVAVKVLRINGLSRDMLGDYGRQLARIDKHLAREMHVWEKLHHPRITPLLGYMRSTNDIILGDSPFLVSPFYANGNLQVYLYKNPSADRLALAAEGLNYLHTFPGYHIAHLDMKMENILVTDAHEASICDFGVARVLDNISTGYTTSNPGHTLAFTSPELLDGDKGGTPADVYAFAGLIIQTLSGYAPFYKVRRSAATVTLYIATGKTPQAADHPMALPQNALNELWSLLYRCWSMSPDARPPMSEVMTQLTKVMQLALVSIH